MKIEHNYANLSEIAPGETFEHHGAYYMRVLVELDDKKTLGMAGLVSGSVTFPSHDMIVKRITTHVQING